MSLALIVAPEFTHHVVITASYALAKDSRSEKTKDLAGESNYIHFVGAQNSVSLAINESSSALAEKAWLKPDNQSNETGLGMSGNTVITAHRHAIHSGEKPFLKLDELSLGSFIVVSAEGNNFLYLVRENFSVNETEVWVEGQTEEEVITLYTCEGHDAEKRRVVRAQRVPLNKEITI